MALLDCEFTFEQATHKAVIVDLSLNGAFLSSKFRPPEEGSIRICIQSKHLKNPLTMSATVVRGHWGMSEHGKHGRFGVRFSRIAPELIHLINALQVRTGHNRVAQSQ